MQITNTPSTFLILLPEALVDRINERLAKHPDLPIHYYGVDFATNVWVLQGITPVTIDFVLPELVKKGEQMDDITEEVHQLVEAKAADTVRRLKLIESARAKLTPEEIEACHL